MHRPYPSVHSECLFSAPEVHNIFALHTAHFIPWADLAPITFLTVTQCTAVHKHLQSALLPKLRLISCISPYFSALVWEQCIRGRSTKLAASIYVRSKQ